MAKRRVAIVDHKMSNLRSITNACHYALDAEVTLVRHPEELRTCRHLILPGVGAFGAAMTVLREHEMDTALKEHVAAGRPLFGICLGFQLLFNSSSEHGEHKGLGIIPGDIVRFDTDLHIPHVGWNVLYTSGTHPVFQGLGEATNHEPHMYFVHSYHPTHVPEEHVTGTSEYGERFPCAVGTDTVAGAQFHPEKSGADGLRVIRNFLDWRP